MEEHIELHRISHDFIVLMNRFKRLNCMGLLQDLSPAEFMCLEALMGGEYQNDQKVKVSELADNMCISGPAMSKTLRNLEEKGMIVRTLNTSDRRTVWVNLTENGRDTYMREDKKMSDFGEQIMKSYGKENAAQLIGQLKMLYHVFCEELESMKMEGKHVIED